MYPVERRKAILEILDKSHSASVEELSKALYTGEATVRRDLDKMARDGLITRTHGGAVKLQPENVDYPFAFRESENAKAKDSISVIASEFVSDGQSLFLDGSSTVIRLIPRLTYKRRLKVITNGVKTAFELSQAGLDTVCTGGLLSVASSSLTGVDTVASVKKYNVDVFFFSCRAISKERGICESSEEVAEVKRAMCAQSKKNVLLIDSTKFDKSAFYSLDVIGSVDYVITDAELSDDWRKYFSDNGVKVLLI